MKIVKIRNRSVGENQPALIIAEVGVNHNGSIERGFELIDKAAESGVDVVKFQTYKASQITTKKKPQTNKNTYFIECNLRPNKKPLRSLPFRVGARSGWVPYGPM